MRRHVFVCSCCSRPIYEGENVMDIFGEQICRRCIEKYTRKAVYIDVPDRDQLLQTGE